MNINYNTGPGPSPRRTTPPPAASGYSSRKLLLIAARSPGHLDTPIDPLRAIEELRQRGHCTRQLRQLGLLSHR